MHEKKEATATKGRYMNSSNIGIKTYQIHYEGCRRGLGAESTVLKVLYAIKLRRYEQIKATFMKLGFINLQKYG